MKAKWMVALVAAALLATSVAAQAAESAKAPPAPTAPAKMQPPADGMDELAWSMDDDDDMLDMAGDEGGPGMAPMGGMGGMHRGPGMRRGGMRNALAMLDLTTEQREKLQAVREKQARKNVQARADLQIARMDLRDLVRADKPNTSAINTQIDKMSRMQAEQRKSQVASMLEARAVLTPDQQAKLKEMRFKGPERMHGEKGMYGKPGGPGAPGESK